MTDILFIVVIYRIRETESLACQTLRRLLGEEGYKQHVFVHDNTTDNIYLAEAYNKGLAYALDNQYSHAVLLDDDTEVTNEYLSELQHLIEDYPQTVFVPRLTGSDGRLLSPFRHHGRLTAFNSGVAIPVELINEKIGLFSTRFPLDYLDYWFFLQLQRKNIPVKVMDSSLRHSLSISDYKNVSESRYQSLIQAEKRFAQEEGSMYPLLYHIQLLGRAVKWTLTGHRYTKETWRAAL